MISYDDGRGRREGVVMNALAARSTFSTGDVVGCRLI